MQECEAHNGGSPNESHNAVLAMECLLVANSQVHRTHSVS